MVLFMLLLNVASSLLVRWSASNHISSSSHDYLVGNMLTAIRRVYHVGEYCYMYFFFSKHIPNWTFGIKTMRSRLVVHHCSIHVKVQQVTKTHHTCNKSPLRTHIHVVASWIWVMLPSKSIPSMVPPGSVLSTPSIFGLVPPLCPL
jgi:hypothetical protein